MNSLDLLHNYSRALDEIWRLRSLLAYQADLLNGHLQLSTFPRGRRATTQTQVNQMLLAAQGRSDTVLASIDREGIHLARHAHGITGLTRQQFEQEQP